MVTTEWVAFGLAVLVQFFGGIWFMSRLNSRVEALESALVSNRALNEKVGGLELKMVKQETLLEVVQKQQDEQMIRLDSISSGVNQMIRFFTQGGKMPPIGE